MGSPALLDAQSSAALAILATMASVLNTSVQTGGLCSDGGTTQGSGAGTALNFDVDVAAIVARIDGTTHELAAAADIAPSAGISFGATSAKSVVYAVYVESGEGNDTPAFGVLAGSAATSGSEVAPTAAEIEADLGHDNFLRLCDVTVARTADTTVTVTFDHTVRATYARVAGVVETEAAYRAQG